MTRPSALAIARRRFDADNRLATSLRRIADAAAPDATTVYRPDFIQLMLKRAATRLELLTAYELEHAKREGRGR